MANDEQDTPAPETDPALTGAESSAEATAVADAKVPIEKYGAPLTQAEMDAVLAASGVEPVGAFHAGTAGASGGGSPGAFIPEDFGSADQAVDVEGGIDLLGDVTLDVTVELGRARMLVEDVLRLGKGSVVELDRLAGDPVDVFVNERLVARGEVLVLNDDFCVRISEIVTPTDEQNRAR